MQLACGLHNHTYIKPRDVQLKIPASSHIATSYFTITTVFEL